MTAFSAGRDGAERRTRPSLLACGSARGVGEELLAAHNAVRCYVGLWEL